jgi:hypothetical protein
MNPTAASLRESKEYRRSSPKKPPRRLLRRYGYHLTALAKKARTPAPPRPVQSPKRRDSKPRRAAAAPDQRSRWLLYGLAALGPIALAVVLIVVLTGRNGNSTGGGGNGDLGPVVTLAGLPGMRHTKGPWNQGFVGLPDRLAPLGLTALPQEALAQHIHQHLDIFINGKHEVAPVGVGTYPDFITEIHTHSAQAESLPGPAGRATGVIHVESPTHDTYGLGQFFGAWGVFLSKRCIGGNCASPAKPLRFYVNGKLWTRDPTRIPLKEHEEIAIVYGKPPAKIPKTFTWTDAL